MRTQYSKNVFSSYYGEVTWSNFFDWLVTLCAGGIFVCTMSFLGGVRPDTLAALIPLYVLMMVLHCFWWLLDKSEPKRISQIPLLFIPALLWMAISIYTHSSAVWLGEWEFILALQVFLLFWVLNNHLHTWSQMWTLLILSFSPVGLGALVGFYQFFQKPTYSMQPISEALIGISAMFYGKATGIFADPTSFSALILLAIPGLLIVGSVSRLSTILRLFCYYIALMLFIVLILTQVLWAIALIIPAVFMVVWFSVRKGKGRLKRGILCVLAAALIALLLISVYAPLRASLMSQLEPGSVDLTRTIWKETSAMIAEAPLFGVGGGSFPIEIAQSQRVNLPKIPYTPHNDYLMIISQYGLTGGILLFLPIIYVVIKGFRAWSSIPFKVTAENSDGRFMPMGKIILAVSLSGTLMAAICAGLTFIYYVPGLFFFSILFFTLLTKATFRRQVVLPSGKFTTVAYLALCVICVGAVSIYSLPRLQSRAIEMNTTDKLDKIVERRVHNPKEAIELNQYIADYEDALALNPKNIDALLGLSACYCQLYYTSPGERMELSGRAAEAARNALSLTENYWKAWAYLGIAEALSGNLDAAGEAFEQSLQLAPNNANAIYYWASFHAGIGNLSAAIDSVGQALEISPEHLPARRLQRKLLIL